MRWIGRWTFNGVVAASLLVFVAMAAIWARGCFVCDRFTFGFQRHGVTHEALILWSNGWIAEGVIKPAALQPPMYRPVVRMGLGYSSGIPKNYGSFRLMPEFRWFRPAWVGFGATVPCWMVMVLSAIAPAVQWRRWRKRWVANAEGKCSKCGYDLRASRERCPECGAVVGRAGGEWAE